MLKYLKQLFHEVIAQGQQFVNRNVQSINTEEMECRRASVQNRTESWEFSKLVRDTKLFFKTERTTESNVVNEEPSTDVQRKFVRCPKRTSEATERKTKRQIVSDKRKTCSRRREKLSGEMCRCENCSIVASLNECTVCLESLQTRGIRSCSVCANIICSKCAEKLKNCPFCRSPQAMQKNRAIERLMQGLFLPCANVRNGCKKLLNSEMRSKHEARCNHTSMNCPVSDGCCWSGSPSSIIDHLKKAHSLKPLEDNGLTVEISSFRQKSMTREGEYTIYLSCHGQLFGVKVTLCRKKLILSFAQIGCIAGTPEKSMDKNYGVYVKMRIAGKTIRGVLPFGKSNDSTRQIKMNCKTLYPVEQETTDKNDTVKIEILFREIGASKGE